MAPMFLVSNEQMIKEAMLQGIMGVFPSLNYREKGALPALLDGLNSFKQTNQTSGNYGVNLIVQKTNVLYREHLEHCVAAKVPFYITSLGNPEEVIRKAHAYGAKVFCDVTNLTHAEKCASLGCDGFIAVGQGAGGHAGPHPLSVLIPALRRDFPHIPTVAAGGIATGAGILSALSLGAAGASIGTLFITCEEAAVGNAYKNAIVKSGMDDIVLTERLSGTPCSIIETPYSKRIGYKQNSLERLLSKSNLTKKYFKALVHIRGLQQLEKAIKPGNYNNLWCAGKSSELVKEIKPISKIVKDLNLELKEAFENLSKSFNP
ncbi:MAG: NAD(P)H-dependent flavin oxidoreductase [Bacteroidota bacterium]